MKQTTILLILSLSTLSANDISAPYTRSDTIDARDKAIEAREKLEASIRDRANNIYDTRLSDDSKAKMDENRTVKTKEVVSSSDNNMVSIEDVLSGKR